MAVVALERRIGLVRAGVSELSCMNHQSSEWFTQLPEYPPCFLRLLAVGREISGARTSLHSSADQNSSAVKAMMGAHPD